MCSIVTNVSMFLFARQVRYYGLAMLLATAVAYSYLHLRSRRGLVVHAILSTLLLAANYMTYAAVMLMMLVDYAIWGRRRRPLFASGEAAHEHATQVLRSQGLLAVPAEGSGDQHPRLRRTVAHPDSAREGREYRPQLHGAPRGPRPPRARAPEGPRAPPRAHQGLPLREARPRLR